MCRAGWCDAVAFQTDPARRLGRVLRPTPIPYPSETAHGRGRGHCHCWPRETQVQGEAGPRRFADLPSVLGVSIYRERDARIACVVLERIRQGAQGAGHIDANLPRP